MKTHPSGIEDLPGYLDGGFDDNRYIITKRDGTPTRRDAKYFVLRYDKDPNAIVALVAYAEAVMEANPLLAQGILQSLYHWAVELGGIEEWAAAASSLLYRLEEKNPELRLHTQRLRYDPKYRAEWAAKLSGARE